MFHIQFDGVGIELLLIRLKFPSYFFLRYTLVEAAIIYYWPLPDLPGCEIFGIGKCRLGR